MTRRVTLAAVLLSVVWGLPAWGQTQGNAEGCEPGSPENDNATHMRTQVTWVKNADGKQRAVVSLVKEMKVARLILVGKPALQQPLQDQIAKSLADIEYDDNQQGLEELLDRVRAAWQEQGYFNVKVEHNGSQTLEETPERRTVAITVNVDAGKQYRLDEIDFKITIFDPARRSPSAVALAEEQKQFSAAELRAFFPIRQGDIFNAHKIQQGLAELRKAYATKGFINMSAVPATRLDETNDHITLTLEIEEGKQFRIGSIEVVGLDPQIAGKLLASSDIASGRVFDSSRFEEFRKQSQAILPNDFNPDDVMRRYHEERGTVDLILRVHTCTAP